MRDHVGLVLIASVALTCLLGCGHHQDVVGNWIIADTLMNPGATSNATYEANGKMHLEQEMSFMATETKTVTFHAVANGTYSFEGDVLREHFASFELVDVGASAEHNLLIKRWIEEHYDRVLQNLNEAPEMKIRFKDPDNFEARSGKGEALEYQREGSQSRSIDDFSASIADDQGFPIQQTAIAVFGIALVAGVFVYIRQKKR